MVLDAVTCRPFGEVRIPAVRRFAIASLIAASISAAGGCDGSDKTFAVRGQVVYTDGSTLPVGGQVSFSSVDLDPPITARGFFGTDGHFELTKFKNSAGAKAGEYRVSVMPNVPDDRGSMSQAEFNAALNPIDARFRSPRSSRLKVTVSPETAPHEFRIEVHRPGRR